MFTKPTTVESWIEFYKKDRFASENGMVIDEIDLERGSATASCALEERHTNCLGRAQGGYLYTLADFALAAAVNVNDGISVSMSGNMSFLRSPKGTRVFAHAEPVHVGRTIKVYDVKVYDDLGTNVATSTFTAFTSYQ
ncbi:MAG: PaaI family thioesterase [Oscillospiraceae bacterium]|jgi:acyl-CoA thioesterase|nr:PaaI family thioesterase [Oscillospiraceae bacterium]